MGHMYRKKIFWESIVWKTRRDPELKYVGTNVLRMIFIVSGENLLHSLVIPFLRQEKLICYQNCDGEWLV